MNDEEASRSRLIEHVRANIGRDVNSIMVVDDDPDLRRLVLSLLAASCPSVPVIEAINGEDALLKLLERRRNEEPDPLFIITDLQMPVMDGWELIEELQRDYKLRGLSQGIPIIVLSSSSGQKGSWLKKRTLQDVARNYSPLVSVAKEHCLNPARYDAKGEKGLLKWIEYFLGEN